MSTQTYDAAQMFMELGAAIVGLAILARVASRFGFSAIPLYLIAGLAFGTGGLAPFNVSEHFIHAGAEIGVLLLLFMLGLEYTPKELRDNLKTGLSAGAMDFLFNFPPGLICGLILGWRPLPAVLLGGVTYISSSGIVSKVLSELKWLDKPETPAVLSVLVLEDLVMAIYLPLVGVMLSGGSVRTVALSLLAAILTALLILLVALRYGHRLSAFVSHESDEIILLSTFGIVLLVAGLAQKVQVSSAIGAFLVGIALSGPIAEKSRRLIAPLRDFFAVIFFFFFGLEIDPATLPAMMLPALALGIICVVTKLMTGFWAVRRMAVARDSRLRAGVDLIAHGEFSIVIAGLGTALEPQLGPLSAAYVLFLAILGPIAARLLR
jgi:CPA2 family monovalent cation:H+ antiporter-2